MNTSAYLRASLFGIVWSRALRPVSAHDDMAHMMTQAAAWLLQANWPTVTISTVLL